MPNIITGVSIVLIFQYILQVDNGLINLALSNILGKKIEIGWLSDPSLTKVGASIIQIWTTLGYNMLICLVQAAYGDGGILRYHLCVIISSFCL